MIELFLEKDYEEPEAARAARDQRKQDLELLGQTCVSQDCISVVSGRMVYLLEPIQEDEGDQRNTRRPGRPNRTVKS